MSPVLVLLTAVIVTLLDLTILPGVRVFDAHPSAAVATVAVWSVLRRREEAMLLAPATGLGLGLLGNEPLGASILGLAPTVLLGLRRDPATPDGRFTATLWAACLGTVAYTVTLAVLLAALRDVPFAPLALARQTAVSAALTALLAGMLYWPVARVAWQARLPGRFRRL